MTSTELDNLVRIGQLKKEPPTSIEVDSLMRSGEARLHDAANKSLSLDSRFDLAYNASHSLALAALRLRGYRSDKRFTIFQTLPHTLGVDAPVWRLMVKCHGLRNHAEYEGASEIEGRLIDDLISAAKVLRKALRAVSRSP